MTRRERIRQRYREIRRETVTGPAIDTGQRMFIRERAEIALSEARSLERFEHLESVGLVRFRWVPDFEPFDDSYIDTWEDVPEGKRERIRADLRERIERDGVWGLVGEYRLLPLHHGEGPIVTSYPSEEAEPGWEIGGSCFGFVGTEPNGYESSIAAETVDALMEALRSRCPRCRKPGH